MSSLPLLTLMMVVPLLAALVVWALPAGSAAMAKPMKRLPRASHGASGPGRSSRQASRVRERRHCAELMPASGPVRVRHGWAPRERVRCLPPVGRFGSA